MLHVPQVRILERRDPGVRSPVVCSSLERGTLFLRPRFAPPLSLVLRFPRRPSPSAERRFRLVVLFPGSTELRDVDDLPQPGTRLRSESGHEWFVAEVLQSGRDTYTVCCIGRREYLEEFATGPDRARLVAGELLEDIGRGSAWTSDRATELFEDVADELLQRVRRSVRDQGWRRAEMTFVASFLSADGRLFEDVIRAKSIALAESDALDRASYWNMTLKDLRPDPEWPNTRYGRGRGGRRRRGIARLLPRVR